MDQIVIGQFIMKKRKEKNLTQEQLAQKLNLSNKTISKWETGKCMPDYGVVKELCEELEITVAELMDGEMSERDSVRVYDEQQMLEMLKRMQNLEVQKDLMLGIMLICMGITFSMISYILGGTGTAAHDFITGILLGLSIGESLIGVFIIARTLGRKF